MKILIFSGTSEGRRLSNDLAKKGVDVTVSVASEYGAEEQASSYAIKIERGRKDEDEMRIIMRGKDLCIDATHPYAVTVSENIRKAASAEHIELLRLKRDPSMPEMSDPLQQDEMMPRSNISSWLEPDIKNEKINNQNNKKIKSTQHPERTTIDRVTGHHEINCSAEYAKAGLPSDIILAGDAEGAANAAMQIKRNGRILLTTGSKDLNIYSENIPADQLYPRILPAAASIKKCEDTGIPHRNIIAAQGPFSEAFNIVLIKEYNIDILITKESGKAGGFEEKIRACRSCGIPAIVITRPADSGLSYDEVLDICMRRMRGDLL